MRRSILRFIDKWLGLAILVLSVPIVKKAFHRSNKAKQCKASYTFLIIKVVGMGDAVLILTVIDHLKRSRPDSRIIALTTPLTVGVWKNQPCFNEVINYDLLGKQKGVVNFIKLIRHLRMKQIDCVIDFEPYFNQTALLSMLIGASRRVGFYSGDSCRKKAFTDPIELNPNVHMVKSQMTLLAPLGIQQEIYSLKKFVVTEDNQSMLHQWLHRKGIQRECRLVAIHPGSGGRGIARRWPEKNFAEIIKLILENTNSKVILCGSEKEKFLTDRICRMVNSDSVISTAGEFSIDALAVLFCRSSLFIGNDTGPMHLAASMGIPTIGLFGPNLPERYGPFGDKNFGFYKSVACNPCINIHLGQIFNCHEQTPICMTGIKPYEVWKVAQRILT